MSSPRRLTDADFELLSAYLDGALSDSEKQALEIRLNKEPDLQAELADLRQTVALIKQLIPMRAPRNYTLTPQMIGLANTPDLKVIRGEPKRRRNPFILSAAFSTLTAIAAAVVLIFGLTTLLTSSNMSSPNTASSEIAMIATSAPPDDALQQQSQAPEGLPQDLEAEEQTIPATPSLAPAGTLDVDAADQFRYGLMDTATVQTTEFFARGDIEATLTEIAATLVVGNAAPLAPPSVAATMDDGAAAAMQEAFSEDSPQGGLGGGAHSTEAQSDAAPDAFMPSLQGQATLTMTPTFTTTATATNTQTPLPTSTMLSTNAAMVITLPAYTATPAYSATPPLAPTEDITTVPQASENTTGLLLIVVAVGLFGVALVSTVLRVRNRRR